MECIVLAGGLGTRLRNVVDNVPKCMAPVAGKPFLAHIFSKLEQQFVDHVVLSLGYKHEVIIDYLRSKAFTFKVSWVIEREPLGTGGGIRLALGKTTGNKVFVLNGDTFFDVNLGNMQEAMLDDSKVAVALKPMKDFERYGCVQLNESGIISAFDEKQFKQEGLINGGVYLLNKAKAHLGDFPEKFSFENDFLAPEATKGTLQGFVSDSYFIDIGIPEDYFQAQQDFQ